MIYIKQEVLGLINWVPYDACLQKVITKPQTSSVDTVHDCKPNVIRQEGTDGNFQFCALLYLNYSHLLLQERCSNKVYQRVNNHLWVPI